MMDSNAQLVSQLVNEAINACRTQPNFRATYRLQLTSAQFRVVDAAGIVDYLKELGVSHVYSSPLLTSRKGSTHGYDVVNHERLNPELGSENEFQLFFEALRDRGLGLVLDIVPNHMSVANDENIWWMDVLRHGPASAYASWFDIDWKPVKPELEGKVLLPVLDDLFGHVLESGRLPLRQRDGEFFVECNESMLPLDPKTWPAVLTLRMERLQQELGTESSDLLEFQSIASSLERLPERHDSGQAAVDERRRERIVIQGRLQRLFAACPTVLEHVAKNLNEFNGNPGSPESFDRLDKLLEQQAYRLVSWRSGSDEMNYRRFFDVTELAAISMENLDVFEATHRRLFQLAEEGNVHGFRIDHIDGLFDPIQYLWRLQWGYFRELGKNALRRWNATAEQSVEWPQLEADFFQLAHREIGGPDPARLFTQVSGISDEDVVGTSDGEPNEVVRSRRPACYVLVEKILGLDEPLPPTWPVEGTTGYYYLNVLSGVFVEPAGLKALKKHYVSFVGPQDAFGQIVYDCKRLIVSSSMRSEVQLLASRLDRLSNRHRKCRDFTLQALRSALRELLASFSVYRTYIREGVSERDRSVLKRAVSEARKFNPTIDERVLTFVQDVLQLEQPPDVDEAGVQQREVFIGRFQQVTSPVMAKGVEDTAFYRYFPLSSLCEVGGEPSHVPADVTEFQKQNQARSVDWPFAMLATTTHDTKRSEDVRARIHVLSEIPSEWRSAVTRWSRWNKQHTQMLDGEPAPSRNDEWLFYQTLLGAWPLTPPNAEELQSLIGRIQNYMEKAIHEAKQRTSWVHPNRAYDDAVKSFVSGCLSRPDSRFQLDFNAFFERIVNAGLFNAASQALLKLTSPGVPDVYQGQELWDWSLVDPDNRRPVDFDRRRSLLANIRELTTSDDGRRQLCRALSENPKDDRLKLYVTSTALEFRKYWESQFQSGSASYVPVEAMGSKADHLCAYLWMGREALGKSNAVLIAVPRFLLKLAGESPSHSPSEPGRWGETQLQLPGISGWRWRSEFSGRTLEDSQGSLNASALFEDFPVALLTGKPG